MIEDDGKSTEQILIDEANKDYYVYETKIQAELRINELLDKVRNANEQVEKLGTKLRKLEEKIEKNETNLITVLGIFTAIVVTFVGTFAFSSSVFQNMEKGDIHRLIFVVLCIAIFIASILRWLFDFLLKISGKETKDSTWWWLLIIFLFLILLACDFCEYRMETYFHVLKY